MTDKQELFKQKMQTHMDQLQTRLRDAMEKDRAMVAFDAIALEALRLEIPNWSTMSFEELRTTIIAKRKLEKEKAKNETPSP